MTFKKQVDTPSAGFSFFLSFRSMSTPEQKQQTPTPAEIPFTTPQAMVRYVTDTGKILPRKYTGLSAKHQRAVTRTIKQSRNMLLAQ
jgi:small subunit ribosomal protein S18